MSFLDDPNVFVDAAACGDLAGVEQMLKDVKTSVKIINGLDKDGRSAFHYACLNDDVPLLTMLIKDDRVDTNLKTPKGDTGVHLASLYASLEALKILFANPRTQSLLNEKNIWGETPLHLCAGSGDKGAGRAAKLLLENKASLIEIDQWQRSPLDVAHDNGENSLVQVFNEFLSNGEEANKSLKAKLQIITENYLKVKNDKPKVSEEKKQEQAKAIFTGIGGALKGLKKVEISEKTMFSKGEGKTNQTAAATSLNGKKALSKLIDFPGDKDEIAKHVKNKNDIDLAGKDSYGLTALMKFASWNKVEFMDMILPHLSKDDVNAQDPDGKTALHWACEMASVSAVSRLVEHKDVVKTIKDAKQRTPMDILNSGTGSVIVRLKNALEPSLAAA